VVGEHQDVEEHGAWRGTDSVETIVERALEVF
jgi:hypothetical protein